MFRNLVLHGNSARGLNNYITLYEIRKDSIYILKISIDYVNVNMKQQDGVSYCNYLNSKHCKRDQNEL